MVELSAQRNTYNLLGHGFSSRSHFLLELVGACQDLFLKLLYVRSHVLVWSLCEFRLEIAEVIGSPTAVGVVDDFLLVHLEVWTVSELHQPCTINHRHRCLPTLCDAAPCLLYCSDGIDKLSQKCIRHLSHNNHSSYPGATHSTIHVKLSTNCQTIYPTMTLRP